MTLSEIGKTEGRKNPGIKTMSLISPSQRNHLTCTPTHRFGAQERIYGLKIKVLVVMSIWMVADSMGLNKISQDITYSERKRP